MMLLNNTAEYALRAMAWLAAREGNDPVPAKEMAEATDIPAHYLSKILRRMVLKGLLTSQKGHGGGFLLARERDDIRYYDILSAVDAAPETGVCAFGWGACDSEHPCPLHPTWEEISGHFIDWAERTTLADVGPLDHLSEAMRRGPSK